MKGGTQGFPRHEVSDKQEVLFEDVSPSTALSIRQLDMVVEIVQQDWENRGFLQCLEEAACMDINVAFFKPITSAIIISCTEKG